MKLLAIWAPRSFAAEERPEALCIVHRQRTGPISEADSQSDQPAHAPLRRMNTTLSHSLWPSYLSAANAHQIVFLDVVCGIFDLGMAFRDFSP